MTEEVDDVSLCLAVMGVISQSNNQAFKDCIVTAIRRSVDVKRGFCEKWVHDAVLMPTDIHEKIKEEFDIHFLVEKGLLCDNDVFIKLYELGSRLPDEFLTNFLHLDVEERACHKGKTIKEVEDFIIDSFRWIDCEGSYIFDFCTSADRYIFLYILGVANFGNSECGKYHRLYDNGSFGIENIKQILSKRGSRNDW